VGVYIIEVTASIPQPSDVSGVKTAAATYELNVINDCEFTTFVNESIPDVLAIIDEPPSI